MAIGDEFGKIWQDAKDYCNKMIAGALQLVQTELDNKVNKTTQNNKLYGTDNSGTPKLYDANSFSGGGSGQDKIWIGNEEPPEGYDLWIDPEENCQQEEQGGFYDDTLLLQALSQMQGELTDLKNGEGDLYTSVYNNIMNNEHSVGSLYITILNTDNPNNKYPGTWTLIDENQYLVSAGSTITGGNNTIGSNTIDIDWLHNHDLNNANHLHTNIHRHSNKETVGATIPGTAGTDVDNTDDWYWFGNVVPSNWGIRNVQSGRLQSQVTSYTGNTGNPTTTMSIVNKGTQSTTKDNRPKSIAFYMWRRVS